MKKIVFTLLSICIIGNVIAQAPKYRRSSLNMILLESETFPYKDLVISTYNSHPFPDKYNEHKIDDKKFAINEVKLSQEDLLVAGFYKDTLKNILKITAAEAKSIKSGLTVRYLNEEKTIAVLDPSEEKQIPAKILKFIKEKQLGKQIASSWFNITADGSYNLNTISERGMYSASAEDKENAALGADNLETALYDEDLIGNTFTVFNKMKFFKNEPVAAAIRDIAKTAAIAKIKEPLLTPALKKLDDLYEATKDGYSVWTTSYLFQFDWSKATAEQFKFNYLGSKEDFAKNWTNDTVCNLMYVGSSKATSLIMFPLDGKTSENDVIANGVNRNIDKVFVKLQKKYPVFRPSTPISSVGPLRAKIGLKEGVQKGQQYEILARERNKKTKQVEWVRKGKVKVDGNFPIPDNRMGVSDTTLFTTFKGGSKATQQQYLKLIK